MSRTSCPPASRGGKRQHQDWRHRGGAGPGAHRPVRHRRRAPAGRDHHHRRGRQRPPPGHRPEDGRRRDAELPQCGRGGRGDESSPAAKGADSSIEALGTQATFAQAMKVLKPGGTLSSLGCIQRICRSAGAVRRGPGRPHHPHGPVPWRQGAHAPPDERDCRPAPGPWVLVNTSASWMRSSRPTTCSRTSATAMLKIAIKP